MFMKIRKFQIKFFFKIHKKLIEIKRKKRNETCSKNFFVFFLHKNVFINAELVLLFERVLKLTFQNAFFNENIFFQNHENERNENKNERNRNEIKRNDNKRRILKKKSNRQKFEFQKFSNCAKKTNAKKISKYFHFKFVKFEKKSIQKFLRDRLSTKTKSRFVFFFVKRFSKKGFFFKNKTNKNFNVNEISTKEKK